jgi:predicted PP-loop superfamily ATPase
MNLNDVMCGQLFDEVVDKEKEIQIKIVEVGDGLSHAHW